MARKYKMHWSVPLDVVSYDCRFRVGGAKIVYYPGLGGGAGGGGPLYTYISYLGNVPPKRVWFWSCFSLKYSRVIDLAFLVWNSFISGSGLVWKITYFSLK